MSHLRPVAVISHNDAQVRLFVIICKGQNMVECLQSNLGSFCLMSRVKT
jgi:hypothetical protein